MGACLLRSHASAQRRHGGAAPPPAAGLWPPPPRAGRWLSLHCLSALFLCPPKNPKKQTRPQAFTPIITMLALFVARLETPTRRLIASVSFIALGTALASAGEVRRRLVGWGLGAGAGLPPWFMPPGCQRLRGAAVVLCPLRESAHARTQPQPAQRLPASCPPRPRPARRST